MSDQKQNNMPLQISSLAELKRYIQPGMELVVSYHSKHPGLVGLRRVVTKVQTNAYFTVVKDQPEHKYSDCNDGQGFRSDIYKASCYRFDGSKITVLDTRKRDGSVLYEMEVYMGENKMAQTQQAAPDLKEAPQKVYYPIEDQVNDCHRYLGIQAKDAHEMSEEELLQAEAELGKEFEWVEHEGCVQSVPQHKQTGEIMFQQM